MQPVGLKSSLGDEDLGPKPSQIQRAALFLGHPLTYGMTGPHQGDVSNVTLKVQCTAAAISLKEIRCLFGRKKQLCLNCVVMRQFRQYFMRLAEQSNHE